MSKERARKMRREMPAAEVRMWNLLRMEPLGAFHFRRQAPFWPYYIDFVSHRAKLIIEVDGRQHGEDAAMEYDARRSRYLERRGYRVLRISNAYVVNDITGVYLMVADALAIPIN